MEEDQKDFDFFQKIVIIGDSGVGKTNLLARYTLNQFNYETRTTIGVELAYKLVTINGKRVKTQFWDTAGCEKYSGIANSYYRGAKGCLLVYDITSVDSFSRLDKWLTDLKNISGNDVIVMLIGSYRNKCDLKDERKVSKQQAANFAEDKECGFLETSALDSTNVNEAFQILAEKIYKKQMTEVNEDTAPNQQNKGETDLGIPILIIQNKEQQKHKKSKCC